jgi:hypothetical protein
LPKGYIHDEQGSGTTKGTISGSQSPEGATFRRFGNTDAGHATSRETCMRNVGYINYGERCFDIGLHADRRNLSGSRMRENRAPCHALKELPTKLVGVQGKDSEVND